MVAAWRCCWLPGSAASSHRELWPPPVPAVTPGSAPSPSSCQPPAQLRGWHPVAPVALAARATSGWRAVRGCPGSVATVRAGWCWATAQGWRPLAVPVMPQVPVWDLVQELEQEGRLGLSVGLLLLPVALSLVVLGLELRLRSEQPPVPPATPATALPAKAEVARFGAVVARCPAVGLAIAVSGLCPWSSRGRVADRGIGAKRW